MRVDLAPTAEEVSQAYLKLNKDAEAGGYHLNPDEDFTRDLVHGLLVNEQRYGYWACPCRLADGNIDEDRDIVCPCDYRDPDLDEYNTCFCGLYVTQPVVAGSVAIGSIPERRPPRRERKRQQAAAARRTKLDLSALPQPVWRCRVCGYLCARGQPPEVCPICKAKRDRFERFL